MVLGLFLALLFLGCTSERDNPYDPDGINYDHSLYPSSSSSISNYAYCIKDGFCLEGPYTYDQCVNVFTGVPSNSCIVPSSSSSDLFSKQLNAIIRDFPVGYYGFEEFDAEKGDNGKCAENNFSCWAAVNTCNTTSGTYRSGRISNWNGNNAICYSGDQYQPCSQGGTTLRYGQNDYEFTKATGAIRGFCNGPDKEQRFGNDNCDNIKSFADSVKGNWTWSGRTNKGWSNPVGVTTGMVQRNLNYDKCKSEELLGNEGDPMYIRGQACAR
ncbi:MAG: hypothetical protein LBQ76_00735, partial [Candidatus Fibromonas sp.]|nr:hypothetical protein [Candidatus Fibromonas sp.]